MMRRSKLEIYIDGKNGKAVIKEKEMNGKN